MRSAGSPRSPALSAYSSSRGQGSACFRSTRSIRWSGAVGLAGFLTLTRAVSQRDDPRVTAFFGPLVAFLMFSLAMPATGAAEERAHRRPVSRHRLAGGRAQVLQTLAYRYGSTHRIAPFSYAALVVSIGVDWLVFRAVPDARRCWACRSLPPPAWRWCSGGDAQRLASLLGILPSRTATDRAAEAYPRDARRDAAHRHLIGIPPWPSCPNTVSARRPTSPASKARCRSSSACPSAASSTCSSGGAARQPDRTALTM